MKTFIKTLAAASILVAGAASAAVPHQTVLDAVNTSGFGSDASVQIFTRGDTVTLSGRAENAADAFRAEKAALAVPGVDKVINLVQIGS